MEKIRGLTERAKSPLEGFNITVDHITDQIKSYQKNLPTYREWQQSNNDITRANGYVFGIMCEERLPILTASSPKQTVELLQQMYTDARSLEEQELDELAIATKLIRKYPKVVEYIDVLLRAKNYWLCQLAETSIVARWKEEKRIRKLPEIAWNLGDYYALELKPPRKLIDNPGKTRVQITSVKVLRKYVDKLRCRYDLAQKEKRRIISQYGKEEYLEKSKGCGIYAIYEYRTSDYRMTVEYLRSTGTLPS
jgi:hypothetical protein